MPELRFDCHIAVPPDALWPEILAFDIHAATLPSVRTARVLSAGDRERVAEWSVLLRGSPLHWSQLESIDPARMSVDFRLHRGDPKYVSGNWSLRPHGTGTTAAIAIDFDFGIPRIATIFNALLAEALTDVIHGVARNAERAARNRLGSPATATGRHSAPRGDAG